MPNNNPIRNPAPQDPYCATLGSDVISRLSWASRYTIATPHIYLHMCGPLFQIREHILDHLHPVTAVNLGFSGNIPA
jgi:hypothetical protein